VPSSYLLHFQVSCEVILNLDHITDPVQKIRDALPKIPSGDTRTIRLNPTVKFKANELIGYTKGGGTQSSILPINRFDLGLYITTHTNKFVNQDRYVESYSWKSINAVCAYDYFSEELKRAYYSKFSNFERRLVLDAPCRSPNQDVPGTLAGAWFFREDSSATEFHVAIALHLDKKHLLLQDSLVSTSPSMIAIQPLRIQWKLLPNIAISIP